MIIDVALVSLLLLSRIEIGTYSLIIQGCGKHVEQARNRDIFAVQLIVLTTAVPVP